MPPTKKSCMVCGDKALGYNFNAVTCESCKAFFRRNALSNKTFTCPFSENCEVTVITRRFCQRCRLDKCFRIGMKKEHIMSEEDKIIKKKKIEQNRAKRKLVTTQKPKQHSTFKHKQIKRELSYETKRNYSDPSDFSNTSLSCESSYPIDETRDSSIGIIDEVDGNSNKMIDDGADKSHQQCPFIVCYSSSAKEIVNSIVSKPEMASQIINHIMKTQAEAVDVMTKIINSPTEAMRFISHLVIYPGDALKIISKIMNSPLDALTVFTKFMSSPNDALQIISRIVNSPSDVLQFMQQLMRSPEDAISIMEKFINTPAEALRMINSMVNNTTTITAKSPEANNDKDIDIVPEAIRNSSSSMIDSMLNEVQSPVSSEPPSPSALATETLTATNSTTTIYVPFSILPSSSVPISSQNYRELNTGAAVEAKPNFIEIGELSFGKSDQMKNILEDVEDRPIQMNSIESVLCEAIKLEYETYNSLPQSLGDSKELNEAEKAKLNELIQANKALYFPVDEDLSNLINDDRIKVEGSQQDPKLLHLINLTAVAIRRLIKMSKKINAFRNMCQEDQVALLKGGCTEMMIMRSAMQYDQNKAIWKIPHSKEGMSNIKVDVLKLAKGNVYEEHERFIRTFEPKWRMDENIILIMCAILLFSPLRPRVIHSDVIKLEQNSYYYLLRRYLESIYPGCEAKSTFIKLIQKIAEVAKLNDVIISVYLNVNPSHIEPLLREIFDLKNH